MTEVLDHHAVYEDVKVVEAAAGGILGAVTQGDLFRVRVHFQAHTGRGVCLAEKFGIDTLVKRHLLLTEAAQCDLALCGFL